MYKKASFSLTGTENYGEIHDRLAALGAELITDVMDQIFHGTAHAEKQNDALATYAAKIEKEDRCLSFNAPAAEIINKIRAFSPTPGCGSDAFHRQGQNHGGKMRGRCARRGARHSIYAFRKRGRHARRQLQRRQNPHRTPDSGGQKGNDGRRFYPRPQNYSGGQVPLIGNFQKRCIRKNADATWRYT